MEGPVWVLERHVKWQLALKKEMRRDINRNFSLCFLFFEVNLGFWVMFFWMLLETLENQELPKALQIHPNMLTLTMCCSDS